MNKLLPTLLLALTSVSANAEWSFYGSNQDSDLYINHDSIRNEGEIAKMWFMEDYKGVKKTSYGKPFLSAITLGEYDCKGERVRTLQFAIYSGKLGKGDVVYSGGIKNGWEPIVSDSLGEILWNIACGKK